MYYISNQGESNAITKAHINNCMYIPSLLYLLKFTYTKVDIYSPTSAADVYVIWNNKL